MSTKRKLKSKKVCIGDKVVLDTGVKGEVRFLGPVDGKSGVFYGIALTEPKGKNNGYIGDVKYFECEQDYGLFVKPARIKDSRAAINEQYKVLPRVIVGDSVLLTNKNIKGIVRFIGTTDFKTDHILYGIELKEASGKHSGIVGDRKYFECEDLCGEFATGDCIQYIRKPAKRKSSKKKKMKKIKTSIESGSKSPRKNNKKPSPTTPKSPRKTSKNPSTPRTPNKKSKKSTPPRTPKTPKKAPFKRTKLGHPKSQQTKPKSKLTKPRNRLIAHNRFPSYVVEKRYHTESNRTRSLLLVNGFCHEIETKELSSFFDVYYYKQKEKNKYFDYNYNENNKDYRIIPPSLIDLCHSYIYEKVSIDDFKMLALIGKGGFAEVRRCQYKHSIDFTDYALKSLSKKLMLKKKLQKQIYLERDILINLNHWLIIKLFWSFQDMKYLHLVEEFCEGGDLMKILMQSDTLSEYEIKFYIAEIAQAIDYLHQNNYVHRDIKPDNVLVDRSGHIKLCDFGSAAYYDPNEYQNHVAPRKSRKNKKLLYRIVGTPDYVSPEVLSKKGYGFECDWWAVGVIMFESFAGYPPFYAGTAKQTCRNILKYSRTLHIPADAEIPSQGTDCILKLLCSWQKRMKLKEIKKHPFFKDVTWDDLQSMKPPHPIRYDSDSDDLGRLYDIDEDQCQLHYTKSGSSLGFTSLSRKSSNNSVQRKGSLGRRRSSTHIRNHFDGFTFEGDDFDDEVESSDSKQ